MAGGIEVRGTAQLRQLGETLRRGDSAISRSEIRGALRVGTQPAIAAARARASSTMPHRGGLDRVMARSRINTTIRETGRNVGIRITTRTHDRRIDTIGEVRHPVFGHEDRHAVTKVPTGWFTSPMRQAAPATEKALLVIMRRFVNRLRSSTRSGVK